MEPIDDFLREQPEMSDELEEIYEDLTQLEAIQGTLLPDSDNPPEILQQYHAYPIDFTGVTVDDNGVETEGQSSDGVMLVIGTYSKSFDVIIPIEAARHLCRDLYWMLKEAESEDADD